MRMAIRISSKMVSSAAMLFFMMLLLQVVTIHSMPTTYIVGDEDGRDSGNDMEAWTRGKNFHAGDILGMILIP